MAHEEINQVDTANSEDDVAAGKDTAGIDKVQMLRRFKSWFKQDAEHQATFVKQADMDFAFAAGEQFTDQERKALLESGRQPIVFNRCLTVIKSIAGSEINGRLDTRFLPRGVEDAQVNELLSAASEWMSDESDAEDEQSEAFEAALICGMGWTETRFTFDERADGTYDEAEIDPREMYWDCKARKRNLSDSRRRHRLREISIHDARQMFPGVDDDDLDAVWTNISKDEDDPKPVEDKLHQGDELHDIVQAEKTDVRIVQTQWWEKVPYHLVAVKQDPIAEGLGGKPQEPEEMSEEEFKRFKKRADQLGIEFTEVKLLRKRYKQAFVGNKILEIGDAPFPEGFSFNCITGERDRKNNHFFGIIRLMRDPQLWANKMLINSLHIANTTAKGGIIAEKEAFDDQRDAEDTYAHPNHITWATRGSVEKQRIMPKPGTGDVSVYIKILEFAIASIRDVTGVNMELLGLRDANQPGILEAQRKQAAMTVLASLFNALRRFRKEVGRNRLHIIQKYLSDGRLIRIKGEHGGEVRPLNREDTLGDYDVIVADAPTSPNQKQETWQLITNVLPVLKEYLTPDVMLALLEYSPFPVEIVEKMRELKIQSDQAAQQGQQEEAQRAAQLFEAELGKILSEGQKNQATAAKTMAEAQTVGGDPQAEQMLRAAEAQGTMAKAETERAKADSERAKAQGEMAKAERTRSEGNTAVRTALMNAVSKMRASEQQTASKAAVDEATIQRIMAETTKKVAEVVDQKMQTALAMRKQKHEESMAEKALRNTSDDLEED